MSRGNNNGSGPPCPKCRAGWNCRTVDVFSAAGLGIVACAMCGHREYVKRGRVEVIRQPEPVKTAKDIDAELREVLAGNHDVLREKIRRRPDGLCADCGEYPAAGPRSAVCLACRKKRAGESLKRHLIRKALERELEAMEV